MEARYSVLYFKENIKKHIEEIGRQLRKGLKIFWFGNASDKTIHFETKEFRKRSGQALDPLYDYM